MNTYIQSLGCAGHGGGMAGRRLDMYVCTDDDADDDAQASLEVASSWSACPYKKGRCPISRAVETAS